jgi:predicted TIM-barrel fold metal-dependent hydrolase
LEELNLVNMSASYPVVDIHTHMYPPSYIKLLASRTTVPYIYQPTESDNPDTSDPRLIILASDDDPSRPKALRGRPVDSTYSSFDQKRAFMKRHGISCSVISLANPWLDFLDPDSALKTAQEINNDLESASAENNAAPSSDGPKLYAFGCLPLSAPAEDIVSEIRRLKSLKHVKGVIMGTTGLGKGLDDPDLDEVYSALASTATLVFLHPHYGLPDSAFGGPEVVARSGHVLPLALGFPLETTIAVTRMYLAGVFDRHPQLQFLLAHSGGTIPFLAGRIESCVAHEREFIANGGSKQGPQRSIWDVLHSNIYLDAVIYGQPGLKAAIEAAGSVDRVMFGTDHPFFPPLGDEKDSKWLSVESNKGAIDGCLPQEDAKRKILGGNAVRVLGLDL